MGNSDATPTIGNQFNRSIAIHLVLLQFPTELPFRKVRIDASGFTATRISGTVAGIVVSNGVIAAGTNGDIYDVTASSISGTGDMRLDLKSTGTGITDVVGNAISGDIPADKLIR